MEFKIKYNDENLELSEDFIDIGYMAENIEVTDLYDNAKELKRSHSNRSMTLLISFPHIENGFYDEVLKIDKFMSNIQVDINCYLIFDKDFKNKKEFEIKLEKFEVVFDSEDEFGNMYGTKIVSGSLKNKLTKSLFLISKDGAIYYLDMPDDLDSTFSLDRLQVELNKAYISYTGVGCHG